MIEMLVTVFSLVFWQWVIEVIWVGSFAILWSLFGFGIGMIVAHFQRWGDIVLMFRAMLYMFVRYLMASGSRCLRCLMFMPSGPVE